MAISDTFKQKGLRKRLIEELRKKNIASEEVLATMMKIPRHVFIDDALMNHVYEDKAFPIGAQQTISHPSTVAYQTTLLNLQPTDIVLEVGTGSGYQSLVLGELAGYVLTIERQRELFQSSKKTFDLFKPKNIQQFYGDGYKGLPNYAPFHKIIVTCGASHVPEVLVRQLRNGGRMIIPVGDKQQTMHIIDKDETGSIHTTLGKEFKFVPMLKGKIR